ncbi:MAG TPA: transposase [Telluria sp.]|nr:transposase [Telluria sp.]
MSAISDDYDTPWKDAVTRYFPEFMAFYFPYAHAQIDWLRPHVFLEQELAQVVRDAGLGKRRVDKLVRVARLGGADQWMFIHIDVQGRYDPDFAERVFVYNYRIYDRYRRPVASLAVLADGRAHWKPDRFGYSVFGCETSILFPVVKLNDYRESLDQLLLDSNVFALVTAAHLLTQQSKGNDVQRHAFKWRLVRLLYQRDWDRQRVVDLFGVIDWMMRLPAALQSGLMRDIDEMERRCEMPYMNPFEVRGLKEGRKAGRMEGRVEILESILEARFGVLPKETKERLAQASGKSLAAWARAALDAPTLDQVFCAR